MDNERYKITGVCWPVFRHDVACLQRTRCARSIAAEKFIRTQMTTVDLVSIMRYKGGAVDILQDFHFRPQSAVEHSGDDGRG
jgi:hypothetical protein